MRGTIDKFCRRAGIKMRTYVEFRHPAEFASLSDEHGILAVEGAHWFVELLRHVPGFQLEDACQEDWGVVLFARRNQRKFWVGLSGLKENEWLAHFHHDPFAWWQRFSSSGKSELQRLLWDFHAVLKAEPAVAGITWYEKSQYDKGQSTGFPTPASG